MIKRWQRVLNYFNRLIDFILVFGSYYLSTYLWLVARHADLGNIALELAKSGWLAFLFALVIVFIYQIFGLYDSVRAKPFSFDVTHVVAINLILIISGAAVLFLLRLVDFSRGVLLTLFILSSALVILKRAAMRYLLSHYRSLGFNLKNVILVGNGALAQKYYDTLRHTPHYGLSISGYIGERASLDGLEYLGTWNDVGSNVLSQPGIDEVVAALDEDSLSLLPQIISATEKFGTKVSIIPYFNDYISSSTTFEMLGDCKLLNVRTTPLDFPLNAILKRVSDIIGALILIILTSPIMLIAVIGVKLSSPGPILFRQTRIGKNKKPFQMYKFRSMRINSMENSGWTTNSDSRKTRFGSLIRKTSIDELPQFFNVIKGDMSLIGPRPEVPHFVEQFQESIPLYMLKHLVRPGITGWAQVNGYRGDTSIEARIQHDIWYIEHWSIWLDLRICFRTVFGGLINKEKIS